MTSTIESRLADWEIDVSDDAVILAGHYAVSDELEEVSNTGIPEEVSFDWGVQLFKQLKDKGGDPKLVLWINDIGIATDVREKIKSEFELPANYRAIVRRVLGENSLNEVNVLFESTMRNRASKKLNRIYKNHVESFEVVSSSSEGLQRCIDASFCSVSENKKAYSIVAPDGGRLVVKEGSNPKCNLILATLYDYLFKDEVRASPIVCVFNVIYKNRIFLGQHVYNNLFPKKAEFLNYYVDFMGRVSKSC